MTFCPFVICYIFQINNSDKNFRKTDLKNPTIDEKGNYHKANQIAYIPVGSVHDYQNGFNDKHLIYFPFIFSECSDVISKGDEHPQVFEMLKSVVSFQSYLFYSGATFLFAAKGKGKNIDVVDNLIANRNFSGYPECVIKVSMY